MGEKGQQKMYVAISAYEDTSLIETLLECRNTADNPEDIVFGVGTRYKEEPDFGVIKNYFKERIDTKDYPNDVMPGEVQVFKGLLEMVNQEDYILKIGCGYTFLQGWDTKLKNDIEELNKIDNFIISGHLANPNNKQNVYTEWQMSDNYEEFNLSSMPKNDLHGFVNNKMINDKYFINHYVNSNFIFAKTSWIKDIKFPNYHRGAWQDQELSISNYCYGYNVASPTYDNSYIMFDGRELNGQTRFGDSEDAKSNVVKFLIRGKNRLFDVSESARSIEDFYQDIGLGDIHTKMKAEMDQWIYDIANDIRIKK